MNFPRRWCPLSMRVQCCICSDLFVNNGTDIAATPCGHVFHEHCLARWLINSSTCPSCRKIVIQNAVIPKLFFDIAEEEPGDADPEKLSNELQVEHVSVFMTLWLALFVVSVTLQTAETEWEKSLTEKLIKEFQVRCHPLMQFLWWQTERILSLRSASVRSYIL